MRGCRAQRGACIPAGGTDACRVLAGAETTPKPHHGVPVVAAKCIHAQRGACVPAGGTDACRVFVGVEPTPKPHRGVPVVAAKCIHAWRGSTWHRDRETRGVVWRMGTSIGKATIPVDPRHAWLPRAARRMYPGWRH